MSYYPSQQYGSYQPAYSYPNQPHYPPPYPGAVPAAGFPLYPSGQLKPSSPPPEPPSAPELPAVTPEIASKAVQIFLSSELRHAGFDAAQPQALQRLEREVVSFVEQLFKRAHEYANHASRAGPIATDLMLASKEMDMEPRVLHQFATSSKSRDPDNLETPYIVPTLLPPPSRSPSPELLGSDDEGAPPTFPLTLRALPHYLPALPPKHTYLRTPASPPKKAALPSLEKKLQNASLVQESLRNLLLATEDSTGQEDGELLGAIVNWETTNHPRKRWKLSS